MKQWFAFVGVLALLGCREETAAPSVEGSAPVDQVIPAPMPAIVAKPSVEVTGTFGSKARVPSHDAAPRIVDVDPVVLKELRAAAPARIKERAEERVADKIEVTLGGAAEDGLRIVVTADGNRAERRVPPVSHPAEALTNLDHSLEAAFDELGLPRR